MDAEDDSTALYDDFGNYLGPDLGSHSWSSEESDAVEDFEPVEETSMVPKAESPVFGSETEILVEEEDAQPLERPIIQPVSSREDEWVSSTAESTFDTAFLRGLAGTPALVRNVAVLGHLHHGKTGLVDLMVRQTHSGPEFGNWDKRLGFTDVRKDEAIRGISIKSRPISLVMPDSRGKSLLMNFVDVPGHPNFSDELTAGLRLVDGVILVVDVVEGLLVAAKRTIMHAIREGLQLVVVLNKMDRLIVELKLPPNDAYHRIQLVLSEINDLISTLKVPSGERRRISPHEGNVVFASAEHCWSFTIPTFISRLYGSKRSLNTKGKIQKFAHHCWGDLYFNKETRGFQKQPPADTEDRSFVEFILNPLYKIYSHVLGSSSESLAVFLRQIGLYLKKKELWQDPKVLIISIMRRLFKDSSGLVDAISHCIPSPVENANLKTRACYTGDFVSDIGEALTKCDGSPDAPLFVNICKMYPRPDSSTFDAFGRVFSGVIRAGMKVRVMREGYSKEDTEDMTLKSIGRLWILQGRYRIQVEHVCAGNLVLIEGLEDCISKTATLASLEATEAQIFYPLRFDQVPSVKLAIEPLNPSELPKMLDGLRKVSQSYPNLITKVEESGEHILVGTGEMYLDCVMYDLRTLFATIEIKVSDPAVSFTETVLDSSSLKCFADTPNKRNRLTMIAEPLQEGLAEDIENGKFEAARLAGARQLSQLFREKYDWDILASRSVWSFGPDERLGPNILQNDIIPGEVDSELLQSIRSGIIQGFQWATREGPLCDDPVRNVKLKLLDASIATQLLHRGAGQIIPTARRVAYSAMLVSSPRLMEPIYNVEITCPSDCIGAIQKIVLRRRGIVISQSPLPGTPLYVLYANIPVIDSFGFETDLRTHTQGQAFCLSVFDHWELVPGDPLDKNIIIRPLEPSPTPALAREFMLKTRRRKGLSEDVTVNKFFDDAMLLELARQQEDLSDYIDQNKMAINL